MEQKKAFFQAAQEVFWSFKFEHEFEGEAEDTLLTSADQVNVLIGFEQTIKGNIVLGMSNETALKIIAKMFGRECIVLNNLTKQKGCH